MSDVRLVMARHGETPANAQHILDTRPPGLPLNERGQAQAATLAQRLAADPVTAVHASVAIRAQETAAPVAAAHGLDVRVVDGVHEVFCGELEGRSGRAALESFMAVYDAWWTGDLDARLPGGESAHDVRERFLPALDGILDGASGDVVLVSHGAAIRLAAAALLGDTAETRFLPNTGIVVLRPENGRWALEHWDGAVPVPGDVTAGGAPA
ncbi:histidine phosphatase family protein [Pseudonocardia cypriaca]|uniref:Putative phosphoglycerate mutase n=1 Tax=Pseudonocardia cypriaca TaxID=882449 RepID=A0A543FQM0_9PSEU|nr:histidine phosphatase family protein [Pseudonocardia cypriaca]TQM36116.1 putative phosphoglycerate mutase [Pseudonocardia cypriaca]